MEKLISYDKEREEYIFSHLKNIRSKKAFENSRNYLYFLYQKKGVSHRIRNQIITIWTRFNAKELEVA